MSELKVMSLIATFDFYFQKSQTRIFRGFYYPPSIQRDTSQFDYLDSSVIKMMLLLNKKVRRYMLKLA
jgi:hypothetical protein